MLQAEGTPGVLGPQPACCGAAGGAEGSVEENELSSVPPRNHEHGGSPSGRSSFNLRHEGSWRARAA